MDQTTQTRPTQATPRRLDLALQAAETLAEDLYRQAVGSRSREILAHIRYSLEDLQALLPELPDEDDDADEPVVVA